jgi:hypothetical protein
MGYTDKEAFEALSKDCGNLQAENAKLRAEVVDLQRLVTEGNAAAAKAEDERDVALLQVDDLDKRIYKIGLMCDKVLGLEHGFCPDIGEPRDNLTRIKIALERYIEKQLCKSCDGRGEVYHETGPEDGFGEACHECKGTGRLGP